jgi:hypothetical protein
MRVVSHIWSCWEEVNDVQKPYQQRLRPERPFDRLRVVPSEVEGRGAEAPRESERGWGPASN